MEKKDEVEMLAYSKGKEIYIIKLEDGM